MSKRKQANARAQQGSRTNTLLYGFAGIMLIVAAAILFARTNTAGAHQHPQPRAAAEQMVTESPDRYGAYPEAKEVYKMAAHIKSTLDGLFCYCYCKGGGHYSLLDCFKDDHGAGCDVCLDEARVAYQMIQEGASLEQIRAAIDAQYGKS
jgi:hypothetical protein